MVPNPVQFSEKRYCRNCHYPLPYKAKFCAHCGQKDTDGRVRLSELIQDLWSRTFHLEGKLFRALAVLFVPGKMSVEYFKGKHKRFPPPFQFFFVVMFFFLLTVGDLIAPSNLLVVPNEKGDNSIVIRGLGNDPPGTEDIDQAIRRFYHKQQQLGHQVQLLERYDSLPGRLRTPVVREALDTLIGLKAVFSSNDSINISFKSKGITVAARDLLTLEPEDLFERYKIEDWKGRLAFRQLSRFLANPSGMIQTYLGNFAWTVLVLIGLLAGLLALLFRSLHHKYVEHFVFLLHQHTALFAWVTIVILIGRFVHIPGLDKVTIAYLFLMPFLSIRRFYGQSWFKTVLKTLVFSFTYLIFFVIFFIAGLLAAFFIS